MVGVERNAIAPQWFLKRLGTGWPAYGYLLGRESSCADVKYGVFGILKLRLFYAGTVEYGCGYAKAVICDVISRYYSSVVSDFAGNWVRFLKLRRTAVHLQLYTRGTGQLVTGVTLLHDR